nr:hypothetical protein [Mycobacterium gordonae]
MLAWRQFPNQIECDLADRGHDIMAWHAGRMSSRRLLVLLEHAPEDGPYKLALHNRPWPEYMQILAETHKELALYRASHYVGGENQYTPKVFLDPVEREKAHAAALANEAAIEEAQDDMADELGWT